MNHSHFRLWLAIFFIAIFVVVAIILALFEVHHPIPDSTYLGIIGTFVAICTAIMLATQIYSIFSRTQVEKDYDEKLNYIIEWFEESSKKHEQELEKLSKATRTLHVLKYHVNDAMGGVHDNENRKIEGVIDVMENIYTITSNEGLFKEYFDIEFDAKLCIAIYFIAKNLKRYKSDEVVKRKDGEELGRLRNRWNKRFNQIIETNGAICLIESDLSILNGIFNRLIDGAKTHGVNYNMPKDDMDELNRMAGN